MAAVPIKFRCFQCNQLLGVSRLKAGTVVNCPKCAVGLIVPDPTEPSESGTVPVPVQDVGPQPEAPSAPSSTRPLGLEELLSEIRIEDIRVEPGVMTEPSPASEPPSESMPEIRETPSSAPYSIEEPSPVAVPPAPQPSPAVASAAVVPPIQFEQRKVLNERPAATARSRDVVLPRSVALAWSLFVLLALALAFVAGLLAGHFLWKVH